MLGRHPDQWMPLHLNALKCFNKHVSEYVVPVSDKEPIAVAAALNASKWVSWAGDKYLFDSNVITLITAQKLNTSHYKEYANSHHFELGQTR